jgi:hypothetical protein
MGKEIMSNDILDEIEANPLPAKAVDLNVIRRKAVELRDYYLHKEDLESQLKDTNLKIMDVERHQLIDLFDEAGLSRIDVDADGNHPPFVAERSTVYGARIPDEHRQEALEWLDNNGHGDLVKAVITIQFGMQEHEARTRVMQLLTANNVEYSASVSVHWATLKAFVKRQIQGSKIIPMSLLGAFVFYEVKIK